MMLQREIVSEWRTGEGEGEWGSGLNMTRLVKEIRKKDDTIVVDAILETDYIGDYGDISITRGLITRKRFENEQCIAYDYYKALTEEKLLVVIKSKFEGFKWLMDNVIDKEV